MSKYVSLTKHLKSKAIEQSTTLSFGELKTILGFSLPKSAWNHRPWWGNHKDNSQASAWMDAGFIVEDVNLNAGTVRFLRKSVTGQNARVSRTQEIESAPRATYAVGRNDGCHLDLAELRESISKVVALAGADLPPSLIETLWAGMPHKRPSSLPAGKQAVYCFFLGKDCLKVGKAGPKSGPRYVSHHYYCKAPSTLSKSILAGQKEVLNLLEAEFHQEFSSLDEVTIGSWLERRTARLNVLIPATAGPHALSLVEAILQCRFQPVFEG